MLIISPNTVAAMAPHAGHGTWIMFVQAKYPTGPYGPIKIEGLEGARLAPRLDSLTRDNPFGLLLIGLMPSDNTDRDTAVLADMFAATRLHHDWYESSGELLQLIAERAQEAITELLSRVHPAGLSDAPVNIQRMAEILGLSTQTVRRMVKAGEIPFMRWGRSYRFNPIDVLATLHESITP